MYIVITIIRNDNNYFTHDIKISFYETRVEQHLIIINKNNIILFSL
jgi:hypothetical protein